METGQTSSTAFGAAWDLPPAALIGVLRAHAAAVVDLAPTCPDDAAAAAVAAHVWASVLGETTLRAAAGQLAGDTMAAAAILARASGQHCGGEHVEVDPAAVGDCVEELDVAPHPAAERAVAAALAWLSRQQGVDQGRAAAAAAADLLAGVHTHATPALHYAAYLLAASHDDPDRREGPRVDGELAAPA